MRNIKGVIYLIDERDEEMSLKLFVVLTRALDAIQKRVIEDIKHLG